MFLQCMLLYIGWIKLHLSNIFVKMNALIYIAVEQKFFKKNNCIFLHSNQSQSLHRALQLSKKEA